MEKLSKRDRDADGGTELGHGKSRPRIGRAVFYTYGVLTCWFSGVFVLAGLTVLTYAVVSLWLFGAAYAVGSLPTSVAGDEIGKITVIAATPTEADDAADASLDTHDQRRHVRCTVYEPCYVAVDGKKYGGAIVDMSVGGAAIQVDVHLEMQPAADTPVALFSERIGRIPARVVRSLSDGFAVEFSIAAGMSLGRVIERFDRSVLRRSDPVLGWRAVFRETRSKPGPRWYT